MMKALTMCAAAAVAVALVARAPGAEASCQTFVSGLCPGPDSCMCSYGSSCDAANPLLGESPKTKDIPEDWKKGRLGGCPGSCATVQYDQCPGSSSCLLNSGSCGGSGGDDGGGGGGGCLDPAGSPCACTGIPSDGNYYLTSFSGSTCACGACYAYGNYFSADRQRYGCGAHLNVCRGLTCVKTVVVDYGPSCFVENDAGGPVLDSSPDVCQSLTGGSSCGWSDHFTVHVSVALSPEEDGRPLGPFNVTATEFEAMKQLGKKLEAQRGYKIGTFN